MIDRQTNGHGFNSMSFVPQKLADILQRIYSFFVGLQFWYYWAIIKFVIFFIHFLTHPLQLQSALAVAVMKEGQVVGHVTFNLSPIISLFLRRDVNKAFARVRYWRESTNFMDQSLILTSYEMLLIL